MKTKELPTVRVGKGAVSGITFELIEKSEKAYLYSCTTDLEIQKILKIMREVNEDVVFKGL